MLSLKRTVRVFYTSQVLRSLVFTIPIWIAYYQGKISGAEISTLVAAQYLMQLVLELPSGALADIFGRRVVNIIGSLIGALGYLLFPFATTFWPFLFLALMMGTDDAFRSGSEEALLYDSHKQAGQTAAFEQVYSTGNVLFQVGLIVATAVGGWLYQYSVFLPYVAYGVCLALNAACVAFYQEPTIDSQTFTLRRYLHHMRLGSRQAYKNPQTVALTSFYVMVAGMTWSASLYFNDAMLLTLVPESFRRGLITSVMRLLNILVIRFILQEARIVGTRGKMIFFPIAMTLAFLPGVFLRGVWGIASVELAMITSTARWILLAPFINQAFESKYRATAISFLSFVVGLMYVGLTLSSALIIPRWGIGWVYTCLGGLTLITIVPLTRRVLPFYRLQTLPHASSQQT